MLPIDPGQDTGLAGQARRLLRGVLLCGVTASVVLSTQGVAAAQSFPPDEAWEPLLCAGGVMTDPFRDQSGAQNERDIVGEPTAPAGMHAADEEFLYLRLRLDDDPAPGGDLRPFAWGFEFELDGEETTYEALLTVDGNAKSVDLYRNSQTTLANDPNDPADEPPIATYPFSSHGGSRQAAGSSFGNSPDYFLELAIPWSDLAPLGLEPFTPLRLWAASSSNANSLNGDFACHDGNSGDASLAAVVGDPIVLDPDVDSDGDGFSDRVEIIAGTDPQDETSVPDGGGADGGTTPIPTGEVLMQGAGGCTTGAGRLSGVAGALAIVLLLVGWRIGGRSGRRSR